MHLSKILGRVQMQCTLSFLRKLDGSHSGAGLDVPDCLGDGGVLYVHGADSTTPHEPSPACAMRRRKSSSYRAHFRHSPSNLLAQKGGKGSVSCQREKVQSNSTNLYTRRTLRDASTQSPNASGLGRMQSGMRLQTYS